MNIPIPRLMGKKRSRFLVQEKRLKTIRAKIVPAMSNPLRRAIVLLMGQINNKILLRAIRVKSKIGLELLAVDDLIKTNDKG
jgi:hypothetical protein